MSMDSVQICTTSQRLDAIRNLLNAASPGMGDSLEKHASVEMALLIVEVAKLAEDLPEWFPSGKWAMIQFIQSGIEDQLSELFKEEEE